MSLQIHNGPLVTVEMALGAAPLADSPTFRDVTSGLRDCHIKRGRSHELDRMQAGIMDLTFRNTDDRWNPWNTASQYYGNLLDAESADLVSTTGDWNPTSNVTVTRSTTQAFHGTASLRMEATGIGNMATETGTGTNGVPVMPSLPYTASALFRSAALANFCSVKIEWFNAAGASLSTSSGSTVTDSTSGWTLAAVSATSPSTAAYAAVVLQVNSAIATEQHYADTISLTGGTGNTLWYAGDLGGLLQPMTKIRLRADWNLLTANQASLETDTTGWSAGTNCSIARSTTVGGLDGAAALRLSSTASGDMQAITSTGTSGVAVIPGTSYSVLASFRSGATTRTAQVEVWWYTSAGAFISASAADSATDPAGSWRSLGITAVAPSNAAFAAVLVRVKSTGGASELHYVDAIGLFPAPSVTVWARGGPYYLFTGYVESISHTWPNKNYSETTITAVDGFKVLSLAKAAKTTFNDTIMAATPRAYFRLNDTDAQTTSGFVILTDSSGNGRGGVFKGSRLSYSQRPPLAAEVGCASVEFNRAVNNAGGDGGWAEAAGTVFATGTGNWSVSAWVFPRSFAQSSQFDRIWHVEGVGSQSLYLSILADGSLNWVATATNGGTLDSGSNLLTVGRWNHVVAVKSGTTGPNNWKLYINGVDVSGTPSTDGTGNLSVTQNSLLIGGVEVVGVGQGAFDGFISEVAFIPSALSAGDVTTLYGAAYGLSSPALSGAHIDSLLDVAGIPAGDRDIDGGQYIMQAITEPLYDNSPLPIILDYVDSEGYPAAFWFRGDGTAAFDDWGHTIPSSVTVFGSGPTDTNPHNGSGGDPPVLDDLDLWTTVVCQAKDGVAQVSHDATAAARYCDRTLSKTNLRNNSDSDVSDLSGALLARYKAPSERVKSLTIHPPGNPTVLYPFALDLDIQDRIGVGRLTFPGGGMYLILDTRIENVEHQFGPVDWKTTYMAVPL